MSQSSQYPSSFDHEGLLASGRGELFGPGNAQLPAPPMLMFDRIKTITADGGDYGKGYVEAELDINPDLWFFQCHFIGDPVMPGCLGLDAMWQMVGFFLGWLGSVTSQEFNRAKYAEMEVRSLTGHGVAEVIDH